MIISYKTEGNTTRPPWIINKGLATAEFDGVQKDLGKFIDSAGIRKREFYIHPAKKLLSIKDLQSRLTELCINKIFNNSYEFTRSNGMNKCICNKEELLLSGFHWFDENVEKSEKYLKIMDGLGMSVFCNNYKKIGWRDIRVDYVYHDTLMASWRSELRTKHTSITNSIYVWLARMFPDFTKYDLGIGKEMCKNIPLRMFLCTETAQTCLKDIGLLPLIQRLKKNDVWEAHCLQSQF